MIYRSKGWLFASMILLCAHSDAANLSNIYISNGNSQAHISFSFIGNPEFSFSQLNNYSLLINIKQSGKQTKVIHGLPLQFNGKNLINSIQSKRLGDTQSIRLLVALTKKVQTKVVKRQDGATCTLVFTINPQIPIIPLRNHVEELVYTSRSPNVPIHSFKAQSKKITRLPSGNITMPPAVKTRGTLINHNRIMIAIDAGHGGQDSGAIGPGGTREKNVTIAIARKLRSLLDKDRMFKQVMTRDGDYFLSIMDRSDVAQKQNANFLVSIHTDAAYNRRATGASVWVLSNRRVNSEIAHWLDEHTKRSKFLREGEGMSPNKQINSYLNQTLLDLQFSYSQRVGYEVATNVLNQLQNVVSLHKAHPEHASLGVLRSPDIPSILVETGFISNYGEERLLTSSTHQKEIADAIYRGLRNYFITHPLKSSPKSTRS